MTREEFIRAYAMRSGLAPHFAKMGILDVGGGGYARIAMPCACGEKGCEGWAMISAEHVDTHLRFHAPSPLREIYQLTLEAAEKGEDPHCKITTDIASEAPPRSLKN